LFGVLGGSKHPLEREIIVKREEHNHCNHCVFLEFATKILQKTTKKVTVNHHHSSVGLFPYVSRNL
jgi:hypothetical protein